MVDRAKKITELTAATSVAANDIFLVVSNTSGIAATKKITASNLFGNAQVNSTFQTISVGNVSINSTAIKIGNTTVNNVINFTTFYVRGANAVIQANAYSWTFHDADGLMYLPNGAGNTSGFIFPENPAGGSGDFSYIKYEPLSGEDMLLEIRVRNNNDDAIRLDSSGSVELIAGGATTPKTWEFKANGQLTAPGTISCNNVAFTGGATQTVPYTPNILRVSNTVNVTVNGSITFIIANPAVAGGNVSITLPNGAYDGKEYIIKNVNTGLYSINVSLANNSAILEDESGNFVSTYVMATTHGFARWVWDATALTYRILGHS